MAKTLYTVDGGKLSLNLHEGQIRVWDSQARFIFMLAGTQSGKTSFGPWWLWREIQNNSGGDFLAVTSTYDLFKLKLLPELINIYEDVLGAGRYWAGDKIIELFDPTGTMPRAERSQDPMWGRIILRSAVAEGGLESATAKAAWLDEAGQDQFGLSAWEAILRRLSLHRGRVLATTTLYNLGWIRTQIYHKWTKAQETGFNEDDIEVIQFDSTINPSFSQEEYERAKRDLPTWKFNMFYRGQFSTPPGQIYSDFDEHRHRIDGTDQFDIPHWWPVRVGVDFGAINTALIWIAEDPDTGIWYVFRESHEGGKTTAEHCAITKEIADQYHVVGYWGGAPGEVQQRMDWAMHGITVQRPIVADVEAGIDRVIQLLRNDKLRVFEQCVGMLDEISRYSRKVTDTGDILTEIRNKKDFHRADALRYACGSYELAVEWKEPDQETMTNAWSGPTGSAIATGLNLSSTGRVTWDDVW